MLKSGEGADIVARCSVVCGSFEAFSPSISLFAIYSVIIVNRSSFSVDSSSPS